MTQASTSLLPSSVEKSNTALSSSPPKLALVPTGWPRGWQSHYIPWGHNGHRIRCKICGAVPDSSVAPWARWKWLNVHMEMGKHRTPPAKFKVIEGKR